MVRVINVMIGLVTDAVEFLPDAVFILAGYSWRYQVWRIWTIRFDPREGRFSSYRAVKWRGGHRRKLYAMVGDSIPAAKIRLAKLLQVDGRMRGGGFDWEPLQVLASMIRDERFPSIGGPPQVVKVYKHLNVQPFAVAWPTVSGSGNAFMGRPLLEYEVPDVPILEVDPVTGQATIVGSRRAE
jgi:hypothetical protein